MTDTFEPTPKLRAFLAAIAIMPNISKAAAAADMERGIHYRHYKSNEEYRKLFDEAFEMGVGALEDKAVEFCMEGIPEPVIYQGQLTYHSKKNRNGELVPDLRKPLMINRIPTGLVQFMLRGAKPEKYREKVEHTGEGGGPIQTKLEVVFVKPSAG